MTSASMSTAVTHSLDFLHVEADGARWHTPRGALPDVSARRRWSSALSRRQLVRLSRDP